MIYIYVAIPEEYHTPPIPIIRKLRGPISVWRPYRALFGLGGKAGWGIKRWGAPISWAFYHFPRVWVGFGGESKEVD